MSRYRYRDGVRRASIYLLFSTRAPARLVSSRRFARMRLALRFALCSVSTLTVYAVYGSPAVAQPASPSLPQAIARVAARASGSFAARLEAVAGALDGLLLGADGDGEVGILGTLGAEDEARGGAGEGEEGVHGLAAAEALRSLLEELLLLPG